MTLKLQMCCIANEERDNNVLIKQITHSDILLKKIDTIFSSFRSLIVTSDATAISRDFTIAYTLRI